ncbi:dihydrodipicolinate synthase family protein [Streptomyces sediminimaris]|uniref:dihydrodipicolinate synthase family protein n=1 Tax=Streptomyces sediminimaris TaxID=3383721 RepID=UPI00399B9F4A
MTGHRPWRGILVATALPLNDDLSVNHDRYAEHCAWLVENGCDGVVPNGSLGEYQVLTPEERARVVETAVGAIGGERVMPGVAAYGSAEARRWAEQARDAGCRAVMLLPPNAYRADERSVLAHYAEVAKAGVPVVAYNNPIDTKVDLVPELLAELHAEGCIQAVKEFSGDVRRAYRIAELAPELDLLVGADDVLLELAIAGAKGWVAGCPNALPRACAELYRAAVAGDLGTARKLYERLHPLLRWDSRVEFVQAIKVSMDVVGRYGGGCRPPRVPLLPAQEAAVRAATERAVAAGPA